jgi:flagellar hook-associated protein 2
MTTSVTTTPVTIDLSTLGLGSGFNDTNVINQLVAAEQIPITAQQTASSNISAASTAMSAFKTDLTTLQTAAKALSDPTQYASYTASSSSSNVVASTTTGAVAGTHTIQVNSLAQAQRTYSDPQSSNTAALGQSGTLAFTINGTKTSIAVTSDESLAGVAAAISSSGARVSASVVYDGSQYRLQVQGLDTGSANAISFDETQGVSLGLSTASNTYQAAQSASATVDGIAVTSPTNQLTNAIPGVTLALTATSTTPSTVTVAADSTSLTTKVSSFVTAYNAVVNLAHTDAGYGSTAGTVTALQGDSAMRTALTSLSSLFASSVAGTTGAYTTMSSVGISLGDDGTLTLNSATLSAAVSSDPTNVERLFVTDPTTKSTGIMKNFSDTVDSLVNNFGAPIAAEMSSFTTKTASLAKEISDAQARLAMYQAQLEAEFTAMDSTVSTNRALFEQVGGTGSFV